MFDALTYSESLTNIGVPENQARLQAKELSKAFESNDLATTEDIVKLEFKLTIMEAKFTSDIHALEVATKNDISACRNELKNDISDMKLELIKWVAGMSFATMGVMFALLRFMLP